MQSSQVLLLWPSRAGLGISSYSSDWSQAVFLPGDEVPSHQQALPGPVPWLSHGSYW